MARRSSSLAVGQRMISSTVRRQPSQNPDRRSMRQTLVHGDGTVLATVIQGDMNPGAAFVTAVRP